MEKIKLTLNEALLLEAELSGVVNPENNEVLFGGLLSEKMSLKTKYWLTKLSDKVAAEKKTIEGLRNDLIKKYGEEDDKGNVQVKTFLDEENKEVNPNYVSFSEEFNGLLNEEKEFEYNPISLEELVDVCSDVRYNIIFKLVKED
jgi:hypothetical protein